MRRGEVWLASLDPSMGAEADKTRPVIIVSCDANNRVAERRGYGVVTIVPLTSNTDRVFDFQALVPADTLTGLSQDSKAQAEHVRSLDFQRLTRPIGALAAEHLAAVEAGLLVHLGIER